MSNFKKFIGNIAIESIFSENENHRFLLKRKYTTSRKKLENKKLCFILINPSYADELLFDKTNRIASNLGVRNSYNEVVILNMFSLITKNKESLNKQLNIANHSENDKIISNECKSSDTLIISWGIDEVYDERRMELKEIIRNSGISSENVCSIVYKNKTGKVYNPAHLSMYITDNPPNFKIERYELN
ncbi:DUF1643 domain-containing protein [Cytobacillus gottheilii]|uniref:DUF1643 domain-containing protein n=1 Tax=Cytobacillus gottheilii TaxID=859144 RepID=A0ABX8FCV8_9BACI|nr:DUF1643 domain-containing protein [Cytobacillus gottheilii]QVY62074.1 DUF1643 domain-containing protein [Cytobacillus gottheilii]